MNDHTKRLLDTQRDKKMLELIGRQTAALERIADALIRLSSCVSIPEEEE